MLRIYSIFILIFIILIHISISSSSSCLFFNDKLKIYRFRYILLQCEIVYIDFRGTLHSGALIFRMAILLSFLVRTTHVRCHTLVS